MATPDATNSKGESCCSRGLSPERTLSMLFEAAVKAGLKPTIDIGFHYSPAAFDRALWETAVQRFLIECDKRDGGVVLIECAIKPFSEGPG